MVLNVHVIVKNVKKMIVFYVKVREEEKLKIFFKKRCEIYLKFSVRGWDSIKHITIALIVFIIFLVLYIVVFVFKNNQFNFV